MYFSCLPVVGDVNCKARTACREPRILLACKEPSSGLQGAFLLACKELFFWSARRFSSGLQGAFFWLVAPCLSEWHRVAGMAAKGELLLSPKTALQLFSTLSARQEDVSDLTDSI